VGLLGDPIGDPLTVPNALLFHMAAATSSVMLNGEGGDPCFGGPKNLPMLLAELYGDPSADAWARERAYLRAHLKCFDDLPSMLAPDVHAALTERPLESELTAALADPRWRSFIGRLQAVNVSFKGGHHILPKVDALSEPAGILPRSPLFDREVVECAFAIPPQHKLKGSVEKHLLKRAVDDLLPATIIDRPKSGMLVPVEAWFQGPLLPQAKERLLDGLAPRGIVNRAYLERLLAGRLGGLRPRHGAKIWLLVTLEAWLRRVFDRSRPW
jgi:asparagine synthase (glutamine-hydrolysing)